MKLASITAFFFGFFLNAQNISGIIKNTNGVAIPNALVSHTNDPYKYAKTDSNGAFTIQGNTNTKLSVAALKYQTKRNISVTSLNGISISLNNDPELLNNVYHISFDHLRPGASYSEAELKKDFPVSSGLGFASSTTAVSSDPENRASVDPTTSVDKVGSSIKVRFPANQLKTSASGIDTRIPIAGDFKNNTFKADELYLSYWIKLSDNFDYNRCGGKLPSLGGDYTNKDRWKGRIMFRNGGSIQFYPELAGGEDNFNSDFDRFWGDKIQDGGSICTNKFTPFLNDNKWHNIELHYKFETPGKNDGYFEGWIDGNKGYKITNSDKFGFWRPQNDPSSITINYILLSTFLGGSSEEYYQKEDVFAWFDQFKVSAKRINEYNSFTGVLNNNDFVAYEDNVSTYPNPLKDGQFNVVSDKSNLSIKLFDTLGREVYQSFSSQFSDNTHSFNVSGLNKGIYMANIFSDNNILKSTKLIID